MHEHGMHVLMNSNAANAIDLNANMPIVEYHKMSLDLVSHVHSKVISSTNYGNMNTKTTSAIKFTHEY